MTAKRKTMKSIILYSGERIDDCTEKRGGFESDAGFYTWQDVAAIVRTDRTSGRVVMIPVD